MGRMFAALAATLMLAGAAFAEDAKQDFRLVNKTGYELKEVYVSPSKSDDWGSDILGDGTLADASGKDIHFHRSEKTCNWDLKVVYTVDSSSAVWHDINLCETDKITIKYNKSTDTTTASFE